MRLTDRQYELLLDRFTATATEDDIIALAIAGDPYYSDTAALLQQHIHSERIWHALQVYRFTRHWSGRSEALLDGYDPRNWDVPEDWVLRLIDDEACDNALLNQIAVQWERFPTASEVAVHDPRFTFHPPYINRPRDLHKEMLLNSPFVEHFAATVPMMLTDYRMYLENGREDLARLNPDHQKRRSSHLRALREEAKRANAA